MAGLGGAGSIALNLRVDAAFAEAVEATGTESFGPKPAVS